MKAIKVVGIAAAIAAAVFLLSDKANANEFATVDHYSFGVHIASVHDHPRMDDGRRWNNSNVGAYVRHGPWVVGGFYNSLYKPSIYVAYTYPLASHFDVLVGAVTGYNRYPVVPLVSPSFHYPLFQGVEGRISVLPGVGKGSAWAFHFSMEYSIK